MKICTKENVILIVMITVICSPVCELICWSYAQSFPDEDFRIIYILAIIEPILASIVLVSWFAVLRDSLIHRGLELLAQNTKVLEALKEKKVLSGMLPICPVCKKIRDDAGYWNRLEAFIESRSEAKFSHSICEECMRKQEE